MRKLFVVLIMLVAMNASGQWQAIGPWGGGIKCISSNATHIFSGTYSGGVFASSNSGSNWSPVNNGFPPLNIGAYSVYDLLTTGNYVFAATYGVGVYVSTNNGNSWVSKNSGIAGNMVYGLAKKGNTIFAACDFYGMSKSTNDGDTWSVINNGLTGNLNCYELAVLDSFVFVGTGYGIFRTSNDGLNWTASGNGLPNSPVYSLLNFNGVLFAGLTGNGLYKSTNNGVNWIVTPTTPGNSIRALSSYGNTILAATASGLFSSTNMGSNWISINTGLDSNIIGSINVAGNNIYSGTGWGIFKSTNYGQNWFESNEGLGDLHVRMFYKSGNNLFAAAKGIQKSSNFGETFSPANGNLGNIQTTTITSNGNYLFTCSTFNGVFVSSNNGTNWSPSNNGLTTNNITAMTSFNGMVYAGAITDVYRTNNNGVSWQKLNTPLPGSFTIGSLGTNATRIFIGGQNIPGVNIYSSIDGINWTPAVTHLPEFSAVISFASINDVIFAGTDGYGIYRSSDNGLNWTLVNNEPGLWNLCSTGNNVFFACSSGVYLSTNLGANWRKLNNDLWAAAITSVSTDGTYLYLSSYGSGSFRKSISSIISINQIGSSVPTAYSLGQNYPNPFNPTTSVKFSIVKVGDVKLVVYDLMGREVQTLVNERLQAGTYETSFDGSALNSGVYFYKLMIRHGGSSTGFSETKKMLLIK